MFLPPSDEALFERYRAHGDARAVARLVERTAPELLRVAFHLVRDVHDAEDIVQATFLAALESAATFQSGRRVVPWLIGISCTARARSCANGATGTRAARATRTWNSR